MKNYFMFIIFIVLNTYFFSSTNLCAQTRYGGELSFVCPPSADSIIVRVYEPTGIVWNCYITFVDPETGLNWYNIGMPKTDGMYGQGYDTTNTGQIDYHAPDDPGGENGDTLYWAKYKFNYEIYIDGIVDTSLSFWIDCRDANHNGIPGYEDAKIRYSFADNEFQYYEGDASNYTEIESDTIHIWDICDETPDHNHLLVPVMVLTDPQGLSFSVNDSSFTAPDTVNLSYKTQNTISVDSALQDNGTAYYFAMKKR